MGRWRKIKASKAGVIKTVQPTDYEEVIRRTFFPVSIWLAPERYLQSGNEGKIEK